MDEPQEIVYRYLTAGPIVANLGTYGNRTLLVPSTDNTLYAVDVFNPEDPKQVHWEFPTGAPEHVVRTVTENGRTLKFSEHGFEKE